MSERPTVSRLLGWCMAASGTRPDAHHERCRVVIVGANGVEVRCSCPKHGEAA